MMMPLAGIHPAQLDALTTPPEFIWERSPSTVKQRPPRVIPPQYVPPHSIPNASDWVAPLAAAATVSRGLDQTTVCEKKSIRRQVLAAFGKFGGNHKIGKLPDYTLNCTSKDWVR